MTGNTTTTVIGNLTADPELKHTAAGDLTTFTVAATARSRDPETGQWRDGDTVFLPCSVWRQPAEYAAATLYRGARVIAVGRLRQRSFDTAAGQIRTVTELDVDELGASLRFTGARIVQLAKSTPENGPA